MYLFFDAVSSHGYIGLFDDSRKLLAHENFNISWNESTKTIPLIDAFFKKENISYKDISNIVTVAWPGSFTGIRTISLVVNTLAYIYPQLTLTSYNFFDLYDHYPIVKSSSKRDMFVKWEKSATIEIVQNETFEAISTSEDIYWDVNIDRFENEYNLHNEVDYAKIFQSIDLDTAQSIAPLYIKKPNIS